jgi:hypothetical protein
MIYLGMCLRYHSSRGCDFEWTEPGSEHVRSYLESIRFYDRFGFGRTFVQERQSRRINRETSLNDILDVRHEPDMGDTIARHAARALGNVPVRRGPVAYIISELVDNFVTHSGTDLPGAFTMQWFPRRGLLSLALGDCGMGIRKTLQRNDQFKQVADLPDEKVIALALQERVSCQPGHGMGLTETVEHVLEGEGRMIIASGSGCVIIEKGGHMNRGKMGCALPGVQIGVQFPASAE